MWKKNLSMAGKVVEKDLDFDRFEYPKELIPKDPEFYEITSFDRMWVDFYANVSSKTSLDYGIARTKEQRWLDNFYGLLGELMVKDRLRLKQVLFYYNERQPNFFNKKSEKEPFDFAIPTKNGEYLTLEIKTIKELWNHEYMIIRKGKWKKSDYAIAVKMLDISTDLEAKKLGYGFIAGYLTKKEILKLPLGKSLKPCPNYPCRSKKLNEIPNPISKLWEKIDSEAIHWKGEN